MSFAGFVYMLQLSAGGGDAFDEPLLEDDVQNDHGHAGDQRGHHQLRIFLGMLQPSSLAASSSSLGRDM